MTTHFKRVKEVFNQISRIQNSFEIISPTNKQQKLIPIWRQC